MANSPATKNAHARMRMAPAARPRKVLIRDLRDHRQAIRIPARIDGEPVRPVT
jgi:hypothetical protein